MSKYDKNVGLPDVTKTISDILLQIKEYPLKSGESLFIEDFQVAAIASLCSVLNKRKRKLPSKEKQRLLHP